MATALSEDDRLLISKAGLTFPLYFLPGLKFKREFNWKELTAVHLHWQGESRITAADRLDLFFANGGQAQLYLKHMSKLDLEQLILALTLWGGNRGDEYHLLQLQTHLRGGAAEEKRLSITQLWEEELAGRFELTEYDLLKGDHSLQSGRLKIVQPLGFGGFSATYLAQQNGKEVVVIKEAMQRREVDGTLDRSADQIMGAEAAILMQVAHPQIARVLDHFVEKGRHYLVVEHVSGQDLRRLVRESGPQAETSVVKYAIRVCDVLDYLHRHNPVIMHLDITPENLLLKRDGTVVLIDFGSAVELNREKHRVAIGKKSYMAPEQHELKPVTQSDIYSLGCTLHYLLTGQDPIVGSVVSPRSLNASVSEEMDCLVRKCTASTPAERFLEAKLLKEQLETLNCQLAQRGCG